MFDSSFLVNFFNVLSDIAIANLKLHFKKSKHLSKHISARYAYKIQVQV